MRSLYFFIAQWICDASDKPSSKKLNIKNLIIDNKLMPSDNIVNFRKISSKLGFPIHHTIGNAMHFGCPPRNAD